MSAGYAVDQIFRQTSKMVSDGMRTSRTTTFIWEKFRLMRTEFKCLLRESRKRFLSSLESGLKHNPKRFWSLLKHTSKSRNIPDLVSIATGSGVDSTSVPSRRTTADNPVGIANLFNRYFASVFTSASSQEDKIYDPADPAMTELTLSVTEVYAVLKSLDITKATGPDEIPGRLLKETADVIAPSLCQLFNKSLRLGTLPQEWKLANVVPVHKKGDKEHTENYRPISLLCTASKVLERCVLNNVKDHLFELIKSCQHGFITGRSCVTNLLEALDHIGTLLDSGGQVDIIYLDMPKAFDKVSHELLLNKLRGFGFGGQLLQWFHSYLRNRRQRVTVLGATSDTLPVTSGVPQGSILGPALFLLYANDLPDAVKSSRVAMFADDTKVYKNIQSADDAASLQADLHNLENWSSTSGLVFNQTKCKLQTITRKIKPVATTYFMKDARINSTKCVRDLGIWVSTNLAWGRHSSEQYARANKLLGFIRRNTRYILSPTVRRTIYLALVRPHLGYATQIWAPQSVDLIVSLERIQRRATKYILNLPFSCSDSYVSRLRTLSLLPICYWHEYLDLVLFFKIVHSLVSVNQTVIPTVRATRCTRSSSNSDVIKFNVPKFKTTTYQRSFLVRTTRVWNTLADVLDISTNNLNSFRSTMLNYYFTSLDASYDPENPRTFKTICVKCNLPRSLMHPVECCF